jgi:pilus assembly protein CpaF
MTIWATTDQLTPTETEGLVRSLTDRVARQLSDEIELRRQQDDDGEFVTLDRDPLEQELLVGEYLTRELALISQARLRSGDAPLSQAADGDLRRRVLAELFAFGPLQPWMEADDVEEVDVNSHLHTFVTYGDGTKVDVGQLWPSPAALVAYQKRLVLRMGTREGRLDTSSPELTLQAPDGSRVVVVLGGPTEHGISTKPRIALRRFNVPRLGIDELARRGLFPHDVIPFLRAIIQTGFTVLISGGPRAGKTTLLVELCGLISPDERIVTTEKALLELRLEEFPERHPDTVALHTRQANTEGVGEVGVRRLVELTRRLNPDRVIVGELVEDEALDMLDAASMCLRGSMATIHARRPEGVLSRLAYYVAKSNTQLPEYAVWTLIADTVDFVIHIDVIRDQAGGKPVRRITQIREIGGLGERGGVASTELWGMDSNRRLVQRAPLEPRHAREMELAGFDPTAFAPVRGLAWS